MRIVMTGLAEIEMLDVVSDGGRSVVQRARRHADGKMLIVKRLRDDLLLPEHRARYRQEFETLRRFKSEALIEPIELVSTPDEISIVFEDDGARSLDRLSREELTVREVVTVIM